MPIPPSKRTPTCLSGVSRLEVLLCLIVIAVLLSFLLDRLGALAVATRPARLQAAVSAVRAAATIFHARCETVRTGDAGGDCALVVLDGRPVAGAHGWPAARADGIAEAAGLPQADGQRLDGWRLRAGERGGVPALFIGLSGPGCEFVYVQAAGPDSFPLVDIVDASCH